MIESIPPVVMKEILIFCWVWWLSVTLYTQSTQKCYQIYSFFCYEKQSSFSVVCLVCHFNYTLTPIWVTKFSHLIKKKTFHYLLSNLVVITSQSLLHLKQFPETFFNHFSNVLIKTVLLNVYKISMIISTFPDMPNLFLLKLKKKNIHILLQSTFVLS